ncbi:glycosyltransferase [Thermosynechococcus sp. PP45]|uniref:glycosyltransferase n=1 Tax=unclassified Thermosynechococcus TaxID=2622553 RepID=UPI0026715C62|nr:MULTISPECIES: glycosyltransferase [unclassified Thermosynechococcus]WKT81957.1 glycosyltransferase [Thermosynechococcus sp. PP45]WNC25570.1 glycosyltransferase [Thermosynechococcus sp. PP551]WNC28149.1 glycosyltransferase [Thermosynechococcus sp. PP555]WNC61109.1 glycosyltransferase [Thermosynechococcus sp. QS41]
MVKKVSILLPDLRCGGVENVRLRLARQFIRRGYQVEFLLLVKQGELLQEVQSLCVVQSLNKHKISESVFKLVEYLKAKNPSVLLSAMWPLTVIAPFSKKLAQSNVRVVISEHVTLTNQYKDKGIVTNSQLRLSTMIGYRLADACIAVSQGVAQDMSQIAKIPLNKINVINNPGRLLIEPSKDELNVVDQMWGVPKKYRVLSVGNLKQQKNHALLLKAFAQLPFTDSRLMLVGKGHLEESLRALAHQLGISDRVIFAGFHPNPAVFYKTADLFVLSSNYEGFVNVIVEALSCGLPVVSTDCPSSPREILADGKYGTLVPVGDVNALAKAMTEALMSSPEPEFLKQRAADFSVEKIAQQYLNVMFPHEQ